MESTIGRYPELVSFLLTALEIGFERIYRANLRKKPSEKLFILMMFFEGPKYLLRRIMNVKRMEMNSLRENAQCMHYLGDCSCESQNSKKTKNSLFFNFERNLAIFHKRPLATMSHLNPKKEYGILKKTPKKSNKLTGEPVENNQWYSMDEGGNHETKDTVPGPHSPQKKSPVFSRTLSDHSSDDQKSLGQISPGTIEIRKSEARFRQFNISLGRFLKGECQIIRPLVYCLCLSIWGSNSKKPLLISLAIDLIGIEIRRMENPKESQLRRIIQTLLIYVFRCPLFEKVLRPRFCKPAILFMTRGNQKLVQACQIALDLATSFSVLM